MIIIFVGFLFRVFLSINHLYLGGIPGVGLDYMSFHQEGIAYSNFITEAGIFNLNNEGYGYRIGWYYSVFLGFVYNIFGDSILLGSILSCIVWLISALIFRNILIKIKIKRNLMSIALFIYTFVFPISIVYTSITLREVYMLCFVNLILLLSINILNTKKIFSYSNIINIFFIVVSFVLFMCLHRANIISSVMLLILCLVYYLQNQIRLKLFYIIIMGIALVFYLEQSKILESLFDQVITYQSGHFKESTRYRASYYDKNDIASTTYSFINFLIHSSKNIGNYFIQPSIFRVSNMLDVVLLVENFMRISIIFISILRFFKKFDNKTIFNIALLFLLIMEITYAQSTVNWGTASRHHVQSIGLYLILFFFPHKRFFTVKNNEK